MKFSNLLLIVTLLILASCGKKDSDKGGYLEHVNIQQVWHPLDNAKFTEVDLTNLDNVVFYAVNRDGISSDCTFKATDTKFGYYGRLDMSYISGEAFVCSQLTGSQGYEAHTDTRSGKTTFNLKGVSLQLQ